MGIAAAVAFAAVACRADGPTSSGMVPASGATTATGPGPAATGDMATTPTLPTAATAISTAVGSAVDSATPGPSTTSRAAALPEDPEAVIVQIGRVQPSPWEPVLLARMAPSFSLQANGYAVFEYEGGPSLDGWYQTQLSPSDALGFLRLLVDVIGVGAIRSENADKTWRYESGADGSPAATGALLLVYVRTADAEARLVLTESDLASPSGVDVARLQRLALTLDALDVWKSGVVSPLSPDEATVPSAILGWWTDLREPYSPDAGVVFGTQASDTVPTGSPVLDWPLEADPANALDVSFGDTPGQLLLEASDVAAMLRAKRSARDAFWGPVWRTASSGQRYLVDLRVSPPGSNHMVIDIDYAAPPAALAPPASTRRP